jgi:hypothetical protein
MKPMTVPSTTTMQLSSRQRASPRMA